jgi:hypothetical protein
MRKLRWLGGRKKKGIYYLKVANISEHRRSMIRWTIYLQWLWFFKFHIFLVRDFGPNPWYLIFSQAADFVSEDGSFGDDEQKLAKSLRISCWLNGAACCLKLNDFPGAIKLCTKVTANWVIHKIWVHCVIFADWLIGETNVGDRVDDHWPLICIYALGRISWEVKENKVVFMKMVVILWS